MDLQSTRNPSPFVCSRKSSLLLLSAVALTSTRLLHQSAAISRKLTLEYKQPEQPASNTHRNYYISGKSRSRSFFGPIGKLYSPSESVFLPTHTYKIKKSQSRSFFGSVGQLYSPPDSIFVPSTNYHQVDYSTKGQNLKHEYNESTAKTATLSLFAAKQRNHKSENLPALRGTKTTDKVDQAGTLAACQHARRDPTWEWQLYSRQGNTKARKRLLIGSYSSYGNYARLLELTAPINKAYAKRWNHDFVILQGTTRLLDQLDNQECEPPTQWSMFNKQELLYLALQSKDKYDLLLLLDADAMIYDFDFDISELIDNNDMLAAHRVSQIDPEPQTWNLNNGIAIWNLHHNNTAEVADEWYSSTRNDLSAGETLHGDQHYLHNVLKQNNRAKYCKGLANEFFNQKGTVAKHFIRRHATNEWNSTNNRIDAREADIQGTIQDICIKFPKDCHELEYSKYV